MRDPRGVTIIEMMIVLAISSVSFLAVAQILRTSQNAIEITAVQSDLEARTIDISDRIVNDFKDALISSISPNATSQSSTITFSRVIGYTNAPVLSSPITYESVLLNGKLCLRRTEGADIAILTDALTVNGLKFNRDSTVSTNDVWIFQVGLQRDYSASDSTKQAYVVSHNTKVQMKF